MLTEERKRKTLSNKIEITYNQNQRQGETNLDRSDCAPVELHRAADPVDARPDHHRVLITLMKYDSFSTSPINDF